MFPIDYQYRPLRAFTTLYILVMCVVWAASSAIAHLGREPAWQIQMMLSLLAFQFTVHRIARGDGAPLFRYHGMTDIARILEFRYRPQHFAAAFTLIATWINLAVAVFSIQFAGGDLIAFSPMRFLALTLLQFATAWITIGLAVGGHRAVKRALERRLAEG